MKWLLIVMFLSPSGNPMPFHKHFATYQQCLAAKIKVERNWDPAEYIDSWCIKQKDETTFTAELKL